MDEELAIVTARGANTKVINRFLLHIRNWEFSSEPDWDECRLLRKIQDLGADGANTVPPVQDFNGNEYEGMNLQAVEALLLQHNKYLCLVLDDQSVQDGTVIVVHRATDSSEDESSPHLQNCFDKMRVPWDEAHIVYVNLAIANVGWDEFSLEIDKLKSGENFEDIRPHDFWWTFRPGVSPFPENLAVKRDAAIKELEKLDLA